VQSSQKITEWRGNFGSGSVAALENIWITKGIKTAEGRKKYANHMLGAKFPFAYATFDSNKQVCPRIFNRITVVLINYCRA
jgi:hypothetical protein